MQKHIQGQTQTNKNYMQYLGFIFDGNTIRIRPASVSRYYRKLKMKIRAEVRKSVLYHPSFINKREIYEYCSHLGRQSFIYYALRAAKIMDSNAIKKQVSRHMNHIEYLIKEERKKALLPKA
jgi:hypothetical protein